MSNPEFVPGKIPIYGKYEFVKKRTLFGLMKIWYYFIKILKFFSDSGEGIEPKDCWHKSSAEVKIHKDRLIITLQKRFLIIYWFKKYGRKDAEVDIAHIKSIALKKQKIHFICNNSEFFIPCGKGTSIDVLRDFIKDIKIVNPNIDVSNI